MPRNSMRADDDEMLHTVSDSIDRCVKFDNDDSQPLFFSVLLKSEKNFACY